MSKKSVRRWVASAAVLAGIAFGVVVGAGTQSDSYHVTEGDIYWTGGASVSVLR
ncbi:hypothetical protein Val02_15390 [Virgisporangium aliadipatigenens]|uniref:Uncharacterized protein n=1 Tax=Virgisporangium aliadipatigenens TaxID=741659 RepID=A0A8J4DPH2_9ACTN|nr:hypothetical protein Val02_15390 [Virgisporangium aliadipatigenens]